MQEKYANLGMPRRSGQGGFTLIEAVVSISLFSLMILGATLQLRAYEDGQRSISDALVLIKTAREFLGDMAQESRRLDRFDPRTVERDPLSYLDAFDINLVDELTAPSTPDDYQITHLLQNNGDNSPPIGASALNDHGFDFLNSEQKLSVGKYAAEWGPFMDRWFEPLPEDAAGRSLLKKRIGSRAKHWKVVIIRPSSSANEAYRVIELHLDDNGSTNLRWPICCR